MLYLLYSICQRYNFESNLQRGAYIRILCKSCIRYVKDTILKAIYNTHSPINCPSEAVFDMSKIQFWKQFTTLIGHNIYFDSCIRYVKDTILKAIYNVAEMMGFPLDAVFDMSKIQFWKQFTTFAHVSNL